MQRNSDMLLILANKWDLTVDLVVLELRRRRIPFVRLNTEDLPRWSASAHFPSCSIQLCSKSEKVEISDLRAVWNRRPGRVFENLPPEEQPTNATQEFVANQWFSWLEGLQLQEGIRWVNHPISNGLMENKLRQLELARRLGFSIPDTLITNCALDVQEWIKQIDGPVVCKALYSPLIEEKEQDYFIFTNLFESIPGDFVESLALSPAIFQQAILPKMDYRITVVGPKVFSVEVDTPAESLDWRTVDTEIDFTLCELPAELENRCRRYVKEAGLSFGAIDLVRSGDEFFFLEINPNGEWGWLERPHGVPISAAMCELLNGD